MSDAASHHGASHLELEEGAALLVVHGPHGAEDDFVLQQRGVDDEGHLAPEQIRYCLTAHSVIEEGALRLLCLAWSLLMITKS